MGPLSDKSLPNTAMLAFRYGTISKNEFELVNKLYNKASGSSSFADILINQGFATRHQAGLLKIIRDFYLIRHQSRAFGNIAVKQGFATRQDIKNALTIQRTAFKKKKTNRLIGDILVESGVMTKKQRDQILKEQKNLEKEKQDKKEKSASSLPAISLVVSDDSMDVLIMVNRQNQADKSITVNKIKTELEQKQIKYGLFSDSIIQCFIDGGDTVFSIARGSFPLKYDNRAITFFFNPDNIEKEYVKKGDCLARQKISVKDIKGKDVFSRPITRDKLKNMPASLLRCGSGTRLSRDSQKIFAKKTGMPFFSVYKKFYIHPVCNILEDADAGYGRIEEFANINISGTLGSAFPVTAGSIEAKEIRGTEIKANGNITAEFGITRASIRCQGDVKAKYIRNSTIEAFGDVIVQHEIIDSKIIISGKLKGSGARVIASHISAKNGIKIKRCGSSVTEPCTLAAGRDDHALLESKNIDHAIKNIKTELDSLREKRAELVKRTDQLYKQMARLKQFHDTAEKKKIKLESQLKGREINKKTRVLLNKLKNKIKISINSLKELNSNKKRIESKLKKIDSTIKITRKDVENKISSLENDRSIILHLASKQPGQPEINIKDNVFEKTVLKGIFSEKTIEKSFNKVIVKEVRTTNTKSGHSLKIFKG